MLLTTVEGLVILGERVRSAALYPLLLGAIETGTMIAVFAF